MKTQQSCSQSGPSSGRGRHIPVGRCGVCGYEPPRILGAQGGQRWSTGRRGRTAHREQGRGVCGGHAGVRPCKQRGAGRRRMPFQLVEDTAVEISVLRRDEGTAVVCPQPPGTSSQSDPGALPSFLVKGADWRRWATHQGGRASVAGAGLDEACLRPEFGLSPALCLQIPASCSSVSVPQTTPSRKSWESY